MTARHLNAIHNGTYQGQNLRYMNANQDSKAYWQMSVNPIDAFDWAATTRGTDGACYAVLTTEDPKNPMYGDTFFARFGKTAQCRGSMATKQSVTNPNSDTWN